MGSFTAFHWIIFLVVLSFALGLYFLPTIIAVSANRKNKVAIFALNLFLGWTFIGWVGSLVWSLMRD